MSWFEIGVIATTVLVGAYLYVGMVRENRRTRPARVRQHLRELGLSDEQIERGLRDGARAEGIAERQSHDH